MKRLKRQRSGLVKEKNYFAWWVRQLKKEKKKRMKKFGQVDVARLLDALSERNGLSKNGIGLHIAYFIYIAATAAASRYMHISQRICLVFLSCWASKTREVTIVFQIVVLFFLPLFALGVRPFPRECSKLTNAGGQSIARACVFLRGWPPLLNVVAAAQQPEAFFFLWSVWRPSPNGSCLIPLALAPAHVPADTEDVLFAHQPVTTNVQILFLFFFFLFFFFLALSQQPPFCTTRLFFFSWLLFNIFSRMQTKALYRRLHTSFLLALHFQFFLQNNSFYFFILLLFFIFLSLLVYDGEWSITFKARPATP